MGERRRRRGREREREKVRKKKYEGTVISFFLPPAPPAVVLSPSRNHFSLSLIPPITPLTTCAALPSLARSLAHSHSLPPLLFFPSLLHPHKWLSETGQVLQNSPCSSTCLIQGLAHCTKTSNTLPTHWDTRTHTHTHTHTHRVPSTHNKY